MRELRLFVPLVLVSATIASAQQTTQSAAAVRDLVAQMSTHNQTAIATKDPDTGEYVAALFYPGVQLLVVAGKPPAAAAVDAQLAANGFQDVYASLQDAAAKPGRFFVQDLGADGLHDGGDTVDVIYEEGRQTMLDGNPRAHKIDGKTYRETFTKSDARYARLVGLLLERSKQAPDKD